MSFEIEPESRRKLCTAKFDCLFRFRMDSKNLKHSKIIKMGSISIENDFGENMTNYEKCIGIFFNFHNVRYFEFQ